MAQWLNAQSRNPTCPVCKAGCGKDKVIPIYGRGKEEKDPRYINMKKPQKSLEKLIILLLEPIHQYPHDQQDKDLHRCVILIDQQHHFLVNHLENNTFNRGGVSISAGFGFFPLGVTFVSHRNIETMETSLTFIFKNVPTGASNSHQTPQGAFMSRLIMMLLSLLIIAIIFA